MASEDATGSIDEVEAAAALPAASSGAAVAVGTVEATLPIDAHADRIVAHVLKHRVTVIHGETGCGKSRRVPLMLSGQCAEVKHNFGVTPWNFSCIQPFDDRPNWSHDRAER